MTLPFDFNENKNALSSVVQFPGLFIVALIFGGNIMTLSYSVAGAVLSLALMTLFKKINLFSIVGVSIIGGISHNLGQILVAIFLFDTIQIGYYMLVLAVTGTIAGVVIGIIASILINKVSVNKLFNF